MTPALRFCFNILLSVSCAQIPAVRDGETRPPNIMIIMADDMGYSDPGCYGGEIHTPSIDGLAKNGIRFTQMYNCARCCSTRASLLTGKYPHTVGMQFNGSSLSSDAATIAEILKENGYLTGMVGKWHLASVLPQKVESMQTVWHQWAARTGVRY